MMWGARFTLRAGAYRLILLEGCGSLWWDAVVGRRAIRLDFLSFLSPCNDDVARIAPNVDHTAEVVVVALLFL